MLPNRRPIICEAQEASAISRRKEIYQQLYLEPKHEVISIVVKYAVKIRGYCLM
jgi:hypothetical protein